MKKKPETDEIFENVHAANKKSDEDPTSLRISIDCKAKVRVGNLSRGGSARGQEAKKADDHDMEWIESLAPYGIQDMTDSAVSLYFGVSRETSDFIVDCLELWWETNRETKYKHIKELVINLDNGPQQGSNRTQFIKRMVVFAQKTQIPIHLVYYPPYHSKYNPIEHTFGILERYWNGEILDSRETVLKIAANMRFKGKNPYVQLVDATYENGVKLTKKELKPFRSSFVRSHPDAYWDITILP